MRVYLNSSPVDAPYGGGNQWTKAFLAYLARSGHEVSRNEVQVFVVSSLDASGPHPSAEQIVEHVRSYSKRSKIVLRVNENDARKGTHHVDKRLLNLSKAVDATVFVSQWLMNYFISSVGWRCEDNCVIHNGVDRNVFAPARGPMARLSRTPMASRYFKRTNIVAHHWSDNRLKGADIYEYLDRFVSENQGFTFSYFGRTQSTLPNSFIFPPSPADSLGKVLGRYDVYVSGSRWDPGPNHVLESLSCGLPTYVHADGGGSVEFAGTGHAFKDVDELGSLLRAGNHLPNSGFVLPTWEECASKYVALMERIS